MQTPDEFTFYAIAKPLAQLGIRVFPIQPGGKMPPWGMHFLDMATTDLAQIAKWHTSQRDYNVGMLAGDVRFLEFDVKGGVKAMCDEMNQEMPHTRMQRSGSGGSHMIFLHTDRSRAIGNRSINRDGHEWFSFRAGNKYLIGAGSLHPNGNRYQLVSDVAPSPIPNWVCDFIDTHSASGKGRFEGRKGHGHRNSRPVLDEDFDFDDFCDFFGLDGDQDGDWFITEECPIAGHHHAQSVRTGFYYDGDHLGWNCFAGGCEGATMSIGSVIRYLENEKGEKYPKRIWAENEITDKMYAAFGLGADGEGAEPEPEEELPLEIVVAKPQLVNLPSTPPVPVELELYVDGEPAGLLPEELLLIPEATPEEERVMDAALAAREQALMATPEWQRDKDLFDRDSRLWAANDIAKAEWAAAGKDEYHRPLSGIEFRAQVESPSLLPLRPVLPGLRGQPYTPAEA